MYEISSKWLKKTGGYYVEFYFTGKTLALPIMPQDREKQATKWNGPQSGFQKSYCRLQLKPFIHQPVYTIDHKTLRKYTHSYSSECFVRKKMKQQ